MLNTNQRFQKRLQLQAIKADLIALNVALAELQEAEIQLANSLQFNLEQFLQNMRQINCPDSPNADHCQLLVEAWNYLIAAIARILVINPSHNTKNLLQRLALLGNALSLLRILANGKIDSGDIETLETALEGLFGFSIERGPTVAGDTQYLTLLINLLTANLHMVAYYESEIRWLQAQQAVCINGQIPADDYGLFLLALEMTQKPYVGNGISIFLGSDQTAGAEVGYTPQPTGGGDIRHIYLGNEVDVPTMTHELYHHVDRSRYREDEQQISNNLDTFLPEEVGAMRRDERIVGYEANPDNDGFATPTEEFPDIAMTAVLDQQGFEASSGGNVQWFRNEGGIGTNATVFRMATIAVLLVELSEVVTRVCIPVYSPENIVCYPSGEGC